MRTSISAFGGWNLTSNRSVYHHRRPAPKIGSESQTSVESWIQLIRWNNELNWLPDSIWSRMRVVTKATAPTPPKMTSFERLRVSSLRRTTTARATASPMIACRDWVKSSSQAAEQERRVGQQPWPPHPGRVDVRDQRADAEDAPGEVLVHLERETRVDRLEA